MSDVFQAAKGCVYVPTNEGGGGAYSLSGLSRGGNNSPILILGASLTDIDVVLPVTTLNKLKILYTFGEGFGNVSVNGIILLGSGGGGSSLSSVTSWFSGKRVSSGQSTADLSFPGGAYRLYVTGFGLGDPDPQFNIQPFMIYGLVASPA